jgi:hypothetical protein
MAVGYPLTELHDFVAHNIEIISFAGTEVPE